MMAKLLQLVPPQDPQDRVAKARARFGRAFAFEPGATFQWRSGPTVLDAWLLKRKSGRS